jgi:hypothetical protein
MNIKLIFFSILLSFAAVNLSALDSAYNDLSLTISHMVVMHPDGSKSLTVCSALENIGNEPVSVVRKPQNYMPEVSGIQAIGYMFCGTKVSSNSSVLCIESISDYSAVRLKPGDITLLPKVIILNLSKVEEIKIMVFYLVEKDFADMLGVWGGRLEVVKIVSLNEDIFR